jgi:regulator of cell morphogenesis and NO signaling
MPAMTTTATVDRSATVAQIVARHSETAAVFQRHRIDFCCRGDVTVPQACAGRDEDPEAVFAELDRAVTHRTAEPADEGGVLALSTPALLARIVDRHHGYLRRALPWIEPLLAKVTAVHRGHDPKLAELQTAFVELAGMLAPHLEFEEEILFPELAGVHGPGVRTLHHLETMAREHRAVGAKLAQIRSLAGDFTIPPWACNSYQALMAELERLEADVLQHVHLENHVVMPRFTGRDSPVS